MASNDMQVMNEMLTTVEQQMKASLRKIGQSRHGFNPDFKEIFFEAINARAKAVYFNVEVELKLELNLGRGGIVKCEDGNNQIDEFGAAGQVRGHASSSRLQRSSDTQTILEIIDSSDDEDVIPVLKIKAEKPAGRTDQQENNQNESIAESNQSDAIGGESSSVDRLLQHGNPTAINRLKCHECEYVGRQKNHLIQHMRTHLGNLSYQCKHCLKKINVKKYKFRCVGCIRGFKNEKEKIRHDKKCLKRRYECHLCKKYATVGRKDLIKHMRKHTGVKPFRCEVCKLCFTRKDNLKNHLNTIHRLKH